MMEEYCEVGRSYYAILGVSEDSSDEEIRRAYRKLAMQWHPDKWTRNPSLLGEAKRKFQQIQEAYSVLSDPRKKTMYDAGLYDPDEEEDEGFADFLQEMVSLMDSVRKEKKVYTMEDLQSMFWDMAKGFETSEWSGPPNQSMYSSPQWLQESFTLHGPNQSMYSSPHWLQESFTVHGPATSGIGPLPDGEKRFGVSVKAPCSSAGNPWSKSFTTFW